jgi:spectinomycin phosphotransferase
MKVKFTIDEKILAKKLSQCYGLTVQDIFFIPVGDSAYSYKVNCEAGSSYYLKLFDVDNDKQRSCVENLGFSLALTYKMYHEALFKNLTYPIKNQDDDFVTHHKNCRLVLFNFIEGNTLANAYPFSNELEAKIAKSVATIHQSISKINNGDVQLENYDISFENDLMKSIAALDSISVIILI